MKRVTRVRTTGDKSRYHFFAVPGPMVNPGQTRQVVIDVVPTFHECQN